MSDHESQSDYRGQGTPDEPFYRVRRDEDKIFRIVLFVLGFLVSLLGLGFVVLNGINNRTDTAIQNERSERINADNRLDQRISNIEQRRRW